MTLSSFLAFSMLSLCLSLTAKDLPFGSKPNVILMITDDQGYGPIGKHGNPWIKTPNLDKLHGQSTRFERFLVSPTCSPTRAALMSGRHPMKNGITHTILERERMALSTVTLPQVLAKAGYVSGIFGKWHLGDEEPYQPHKRGSARPLFTVREELVRLSNALAPMRRETSTSTRPSGTMVPS